MPFPDGLLINGNPSNTVITAEAGKTYMLRVSNMGIMTSINFRIQGHKLKVVEVEGTHVLQETYKSIDIHPGQSMTFLFTLNGKVKDYYIVASSRFMKKVLTAKAILQYSGSNIRTAGSLPAAPTSGFHWSMKQARTFRKNLTANAARPNPQGSFHYGGIKVTRSLVLANSEDKINGNIRYAVNKVSYINPDTPLKLADYYNICGVFNLSTIKDTPPTGTSAYGTSVVDLAIHDFAEIVFQNNENSLQSWHLDGHSFFVVAYGSK